MATLRLSDALFSQGFGVRRVCDGLVSAGHVQVNGHTVTDPDAAVDSAALRLTVDGQHWPFHASALVLLHKPAGYECSKKPSAWPSVMLLLPAPLRQRGRGGVQPVGRLDQDTTGVLLLTDDGALLHRLTSPRHHVPKVYEVGTARPVDAAQCQRLRDGVVLADDPQPVRAADCQVTGPQSLRLTLTEGKYHQVKRMLAAIGNHCAALHRSAIGGLDLSDGLAPGAWRFVSDAERAALLNSPPPPGRGTAGRRR